MTNTLQLIVTACLPLMAWMGATVLYFFTQVDPEEAEESVVNFVFWNCVLGITLFVFIAGATGAVLVSK